MREYRPNDSRWVPDSLLGACVDDYGRVLLVQHVRDERVLHVQHSMHEGAQGQQSVSIRQEPTRCAPEKVHVEDLVPIVKAVPGRALGRNRGVVHEHANLPEQRRRERCEVFRTDSTLHAAHENR